MANELAEARALMSAGNHADALAIVDKALSQKPSDAHTLFLKGLILNEQGQTANAVAAFTRMTELHPSLPEPHNNLAVLHAAAGQYDKARASLEAALRTNRAYSTAYENLGDLYAKLASQAYDKALQTNNSKNANRKSKLTLVQSVVTEAPGVRAAAPVIVAAAPKPAPVPEPAPAPAPAKTEPKTAPKPEAKPAPAPEPKPAPKATEGGNAERDDVAKTLNDWAAAWSAKDVKKYLAFYASDFKTPKGMTHKAWADERRGRIVGKGRISVKVESPQITVSGNTATAKFKQAYTSDRLSSSTKKTIVFTKSGGKWKIKQEQAN